jgi:hypothetical protein
MKLSLLAATPMGHRCSTFPSKRSNSLFLRPRGVLHNAMRDLRVPRLTALTAAFCVSEAQRARRSVYTCVPGSPSDSGVAPCQHSDYGDRSSHASPPPRSLWPNGSNLRANLRVRLCRQADHRELDVNLFLCSCARGVSDCVRLMQSDP